MSAILRHTSLGATLHGLQFDSVWQFRGLQYANVPARFASPEPSTALSGDVDCTSYGPRCPQNHVDFRHLLRIPLDEEIPTQEEDEFLCLNLDITMPALSVSAIPNRALPVLIWIHGGSQTVSFGTSSSKLCDPTNLVATSIATSHPLIVVTINYRLNVFAFGDGTGEVNLALKDQRKAIEFIVLHIADFGGDPENITLAGESAGAVYCHAQMVMDAPIRQCILQSGGLDLSPPQPKANANDLVHRMGNTLTRSGNWTLRDAPVQQLLDMQAELGLVSFYIQTEEQLQGWEEKHGSVERLLVGDVEYEAVLWRSGVEKLSASEIVAAFELFGEESEVLQKLYGIVADRPVSCKLGALDLMNDAKFTLPVEVMSEKWRASHRPVFRFLVDQPNPWQSSSRAHHAVDLLYIFGGFDLSFEPAAQHVSLEMQKKWLQFVHGEDPWQPGGYWAFGPHGESKCIDESGFRARRRKRHIEALIAVGADKVNAVYRALATGRLSLFN